MRSFVAVVVLASGLVLGVATWAIAQETPTADFAIVSNAPNVRHAKVGKSVTFRIAARNNGPDAADFNVHAIFDFPVYGPFPGPCYRAAYANNGDNGFFSSDGPFCEYGRVEAGETVAMYLSEYVPTGSKYQSVTACVLTFDPPLNDSNPTNDCATETLRIVGRRK